MKFHNLIFDWKNMIKSALQKFFEYNQKLSLGYFRLFNKLFKLPLNYGPDNAWRDYDLLLENILNKLHSSKSASDDISILEVGAGKTSSFNQFLKEKYSLKITGLDISEEELKENTLNDSNIIFDATNTDYKSYLKEVENKFDLVVSKMFLEHINDPEVTHKLIAFCLKPEGLAMHFHPTLYDPSFLLNRLLNHKTSSGLVKFLNPTRQAIGVFPAYYKNCTAINKKLTTFFDSCGYNLSFERHYYGAAYFSFFLPIYIIIFHLLLFCCNFDLKTCTAYSLFCLQKKPNCV